ncbi:MAG TPA: SDR family NAD(P)-dependent oxidoreductase, partial [Mycobacterium sp.]|nr:SDR family NAD(P)-dependent oxidoreductase [Mycobacterium sp.]
MHFEAKKVVVVGGSAGIGRQAAVDVVDHGGSAVIVGRSKARVDDTVAELMSRSGEAWNAGDEPARILEIISPAGFEQFFDEVSVLGGVDKIS